MQQKTQKLVLLKLLLSRAKNISLGEHFLKQIFLLKLCLAYMQGFLLHMLILTHHKQTLHINQ